MAKAVLESKVEKDIRIYAKAKGWWVAKFVSPGTVGVPDRIMIKDGVVVFFEVKRPGEEARTNQVLRMEEMRRHGALVYEVDNFDAFKKIIKQFDEL